MISRCFGMFWFIPHNDEVIYTDVAMQMASDWATNQYLTLNGSLFDDYKEPLQYWLTSLTVTTWDNPLIGMRLWSLVMGGLGLTCTYLLVARLWDVRAASITGGLIVLSEYYFYFDAIALHEAHIYGWGTFYLYTLYLFLEETPEGSPRPRHLKRLGFAVLAILGLTACLMSKTSGQMWLILGGAMPFCVLAVRHNHWAGKTRLIWQQGMGKLAWVGLLALASEGVHRLFIPAQFAAIKEASYQVGLVRSSDELLALPFQAWWNNLEYYFRKILWAEFDVATGLVLGIYVVMLWLLWIQKRSHFGRYCVLLVLWCLSFLPLVLVAKGLTPRYFGVGLYWFYALAGVTLSWAWYQERFQKSIRIALIAGLTVLILSRAVFSYLPLLTWKQNDYALQETIPGWANGANIMELVKQVSQLPPGTIWADPQWGHPTTTLRIFQHRYPHLSIENVTRDRLDQVFLTYLELQKSGKNLYFVFDARVVGERPVFDQIFQHPLLCGKRLVIPKGYRGVDFPNSRYVLCEMTGVR